LVQWMGKILPPQPLKNCHPVSDNCRRSGPWCLKCVVKDQNCSHSSCNRNPFPRLARIRSTRNYNAPSPANARRPGSWDPRWDPGLHAMQVIQRRFEGNGFLWVLYYVSRSDMQIRFPDSFLLLARVRSHYKTHAGHAVCWASSFLRHAISCDDRRFAVHPDDVHRSSPEPDYGSAYVQE